MASECAIIATNINGISEQVKDGYNGHLIKPENSAIIAEKINLLLDNKQKMYQMGRNSRKRIIKEKLTWYDYSKRILDIYEKMI